jgi:ribosome-binding protein aMBF1 (putative translation factor)
MLGVAGSSARKKVPLADRFARLRPMTRHCWKCGCEFIHNRTPGRSETCEQCQADLRVCRNCFSYDTTVAYHCRDRRADPVEDKAAATYCEYFEFAKREFTRPSEENQREQAARDALKKLLG